MAGTPSADPHGYLPKSSSGGGYYDEDSDEDENSPLYSRTSQKMPPGTSYVVLPEVGNEVLQGHVFDLDVLEDQVGDLSIKIDNLSDLLDESMFAVDDAQGLSCPLATTSAHTPLPSCVFAHIAVHLYPMVLVSRSWRYNRSGFLSLLAAPVTATTGQRLLFLHIERVRRSDRCLIDSNRIEGEIEATLRTAAIVHKRLTALPPGLEVADFKPEERELYNSVSSKLFAELNRISEIKSRFAEQQTSKLHKTMRIRAFLLLLLS